MFKGLQVIRNGQKVWPTCNSCGCRLEILENGAFVTLRHFWGGYTKDARGCICEQINKEWSMPKRIMSHFGYC